MSKIKKVTIHQQVPKEHRRYVRKASTDLGLDRINSDEFYNLKKVGTKNRGNYGEGTMVRGGKVLIVGSDKHVALFVADDRGNWFRTSPIVNSSLGKNGSVLIETMNSMYELELCSQGN